MDPAKKQYWIFSAVVSLMFSVLVNFVFFELVKSSFLYGFPISLKGTEGFLNFVFKILNTLIIAALATPGVYFFFMWFIRRAR